jgi:hypothetical protein
LSDWFSKPRPATNNNWPKSHTSRALLRQLPHFIFIGLYCKISIARFTYHNAAFDYIRIQASYTQSVPSTMTFSFMRRLMRIEYGTHVSGAYYDFRQGQDGALGIRRRPVCGIVVCDSWERSGLIAGFFVLTHYPGPFLFFSFPFPFIRVCVVDQIIATLTDTGRGGRIISAGGRLHTNVHKSKTTV